MDGFRIIATLQLGFTSFRGAGPILPFLELISLPLNGETNGGAEDDGVMRGGGLIGFGFLPLDGGKVGTMSDEGQLPMLKVFRDPGVGRRGGATRTGAGGAPNGILTILVYTRARGVKGTRAGSQLVSYKVGVRLPSKPT